MIIWVLFFLHLFALICGLIRSIAAPVVPIQEAKIVPIDNNKRFILGVPIIVPLKHIPPATVNNDNKRIIKGIYSKSIT